MEHNEWYSESSGCRESIFSVFEVDVKNGNGWFQFWAQLYRMSHEAQIKRVCFLPRFSCNSVLAVKLVEIVENSQHFFGLFFWLGFFFILMMMTVGETNQFKQISDIENHYRKPAILLLS